MPSITVGKTKVHIFQPPPKGFDPLSGSAAELQRYGFPRRPDPVREAAASLRWVKGMTTYRDLKLQHVVPQFRELPKIVHGPNKRVNPASRGLVNATSSNWSGTVVFTDPTLDPFTWMGGDWTVPNAYSPNPGDGKTYYSSAWLGIDGDESPDVLQAGTATEVTGAAPAVCYAWMEWYPDFSHAIVNFPFATGDAASLTICTDSSTSASVYFGNLTSQQYTSFTLTAPPGTTLVGNCAEAVVERPGVGGSLAELPRYGENFFDGVNAFTKSGAGFGLGTGTTISMLADDGVKLISQAEVEDSDAIRLFYTGP